ncbi:di-trans,poly-cis-decaprenylcistransferase [Pseudidiomarina sediminum]|uniref:Ditrans,polycis-undecaprenyl-diphosphate synthase ((2E,6E)-farnesyl-diphosphate specific) n=1 Tax=Pseudidiomarina sediminum TaxID=431675 RepID=A0A432Z858_9GAMM|nr:polyprenyl diphosphate synthase [Pseudidiomarina sediminum]MBY6063223.1 di-trans,poly-cis-decaprenylcistransferase [Pseudidiomarina sediminum]RUO74068.1 di-trans,poly-cis-decaprenylcistransferase [Pseudidiomarina sediminum]
MDNLTFEQIRLPQHVAIIMDGNGRWAQLRGKHRTFGHKAGAQAVREAVTFARKKGIQSLTLFAFSSENWKRPEQEVSVLMELFFTVLKREVKKLHKHNVRLRIIGDTSGFSEKLQQRIHEAEAMTADNTALTLNIAANYGGRWDITQAAKQLAQAVEEGKLKADDITESMLAEQLTLTDQPVPDLLIRTGGEHRISNFLLWQLAYAEYYFTDVLWPDFDAAAFAQAIADFSCRERRFGLTSAQVQQAILNTDITSGE